MNTRTVVIGIGNPFRRDDGAGPAVVDLLRGRLTGVEFVVCDGEPTTVIDAWTGAGRAVVVDATRTADGEAGRIHRFATGHPSATRAGITASHAADLGDTVALARALDRMPDTLLVYTVEVADVCYGTGMSPAVVAATGRLADDIAAVLG
ncbi:hydrogenase maturation protease [Virgisporangium ochraceum]|uniref:Peptidase M52 n=1 Tax=Virgisporangium ochraceum TaxID=65505 RepID=A0A8J3ZXP7_9ACTN|nr:hydrogenase maturation protease [Virgisporangium ochraceum]GIJ71551.1 peptidase M52 [Virgisporangium ochraceum]